MSEEKVIRYEDDNASSVEFTMIAYSFKIRVWDWEGIEVEISKKQAIELAKSILNYYNEEQK